MKMAWTEYPDLQENKELMDLELDLLDEKREAAKIQNLCYQQEIARSYNKR